MKRYRMFITAAIVFLASMPSCTREEYTKEVNTASGRHPFSLEIQDVRRLDTKSVLTATDIETRVSSVTLAAYSVSDGSLLAKEHFTEGFDRMALDLFGEPVVSVYALANMGDMRNSFPSHISGIDNIQYVIPSYTGSSDSVEERGIPMSGTVYYNERASEESSVIPLRRLLAKIAVDLCLHWPGTISTVQIKNMNSLLTPFGTSKADKVSEVFHAEIESGGDLSAGSFVFFVPENIQGRIGSATSSSDKNNTDPEIDAKKDVLTYMEVSASGSGKYNGTIKYRSYLGHNSTDDFSIAGNCRYTWKVDYLQDGTTINDWKHDNDLSWSDYRYQAFARPSKGYIGDPMYVYLRKAEDKYEKGTLKSAGTLKNTDTFLADWTREEWSPANFLRFDSVFGGSQDNFRIYLGMREGEGYVKATVSDETGTYTDRALLTCLGPKPVLLLGGSPISIRLGESVQLTLTLDGDDIMGKNDTYFYLEKGIFFDPVSGKRNTADYNYDYIGRDGKWIPTKTGTYVMYAQYYGQRVVIDVQSNTISIVVSDPDPATDPDPDPDPEPDPDPNPDPDPDPQPDPEPDPEPDPDPDPDPQPDPDPEPEPEPEPEPNIVSYVLAVDPVNPASKMVGQTISLKAYLCTYVNDSQTARENVSSSAKWECDDACVTISKGVVSTTLPGTFAIKASYKDPHGETQSSMVNVSFTADPNFIILSINPSNILSGETSKATVMYNGSTNVSSSSTIKAFTAETGTTASSRVGISGRTVTGLSVGDCWLEASYTTSGRTYTSARVKMTVMPDTPPVPPLTVAWDSEPSYVAQRGKFAVSGLQSGETISSYQATAGSERVRLSPSGTSCLVSLLKTGSYTIKVTTSKKRSVTLSGTVKAPVLTLNADVFYANPDGTEAHTGTDGLTGNSLRVGYSVGGTAAAFVNDGIAVGNQLLKSLYEELLAPSLSSSSSLLYVYDTGVYAKDTYEYSGSNGAVAHTLGTVTVAPKETSSGIASKTFTVRKVNPFVGWGSVSQREDVEDWSLLSGYYTHTKYYNDAFYTNPVVASTGQCGFTVFINEQEAPSDFAALFSGNVNANGGRVSWSLSQAVFSGLSEHYAGDVTLRAYVRNRHSGNRLFRPFVSFRLFVHGAVGARVVMDKPKTVSGRIHYEAMLMQAGFVGNISGTPFANNGSGGMVIYSVASTFDRWDAVDHGLGSCPYFIANSQEMINFTTGNDYILQIIPGRKKGTVPETYEPAYNQYFLSSDAEAFRMSTPSNLTWGTVINTAVVRKDGNILYMKNDSDEPDREVGGQGGLGYYVLHLLKDIQNSGAVNGNNGWIR